MQVVIDANIVIAMLIKPGKPIGLISHNGLDIFAPELLFKEIKQNIETIIDKSRLTKDEIHQFITALRNNINIIPEEEFLKHRGKAEEICPDPKDITYFALALHLKCAIWTNENKLKEQNQIPIYKTHELFHLFLLK